MQCFNHLYDALFQYVHDAIHSVKATEKYTDIVLLNSYMTIIYYNINSDPLINIKDHSLDLVHKSFHFRNFSESQ